VSSATLTRKDEGSEQWTQSFLEWRLPPRGAAARWAGPVADCLEPWLRG